MNVWFGQPKPCTPPTSQNFNSLNTCYEAKLKEFGKVKVLQHPIYDSEVAPLIWTITCSGP